MSVTKVEQVVAEQQVDGEAAVLDVLVDDALEGSPERVRHHLRRTPVRRTQVEPFTTQLYR